MSIRRWFLVLPLVGAVACTSTPSTPEADAGTKADGGEGVSDAGSHTDAGTEVDAGWPYDCPIEACQVADKNCLAFADHTGEDSSLLRVSQMTLTTPPVLSVGLLSSIVNSSILPDAADCSLNGTGRASWLMEFNTSGGSPTVKTGTGRMNTGDGSYSWVDRDVDFSDKLVPVKPKTLALSLGEQGHFETTTTADLNIMVADDNGEAVAMLPIQGVSLSGALSSNHNCIGHYQAELLSSDNACQTENDMPYFAEGGTVKGFITLETADDLFIPFPAESLCVALSGNPAMYGNGANPAKCKRDSSAHILYQGNWCSDTNAPAAGDCADAVRLEGTFAASAVAVDNSVE